MTNVAVFYGCFTAASGYAAIFGAAPERWAAGILTASVVVDTVLVQLTATVFVGREPGLLALDVATLAAITAVALRAERIWPLVMAAFLLVGVELQAAVWLAPVVNRQIYKLAHAYSAYPVLLILVVGVARHRRRTKDVAERSWSAF